MKNPFPWPVLASVLSSLLTGHVSAQTFTALHRFTRGSDGGGPYSTLVLVGNTLYGTTLQGGNGKNGTVFKVSTDGSDFEVLHAFAPGTGSLASVINSEGAEPFAGVIL